MSRIPSIYSLVDPAPYLVDLDEEYDDYDDYEDYRYLQPDDEHLSLPSSPPPLSPQSVSSGSAVEGLRGLDDEEELDAVHGVPYESLSDIDGLSDASIYGGFYDAIPYSLGDGDSDGDSIGESSDLQSQQSSIASPDSDLVSLSLSPSPSTSPSPSPVSAASPSSPASPGSLGYDSVLDSASAADLQLELDLDGSSGSASEPESEPASASSLGAPDRASHQRARRQPQARIIHIHHNRRLPGTHFHLQPPRPDNPPAPPHRNIRANRNALADFSPYNEFTGHQHPRFQARARYFAAHGLDPSENVDILDQFNPHLSSPEVDSENQEDEEDEEDDLPLREHLRFRRARRAIRAAREANRPGGRRSSGAHRRRIPRFEIIWDSDLEEVVEEDHMNNMDIDDELVEVVYQGSVPAPPTPPRRQQRHPRQQRHQHNHNHHHPHHHQHVDVIDLTEEPDSPVLHRHQPVNILRNRPLFRDHDRDHDNPYRNPRRQISQNGRTPSLNRSDGSLLNGNAAAIIDLTMDSPDDNNIPANRRLPPPAPAPVQRDQHNHIFGRNFMGSIRGLLPGLLAYGNIREADIQFIGAAPAIPMNANPLAGNPPDFNYQANGFGGYGGGRQPTPKPDFEAPPAARAGFTRDTGPDKVTDEEQVFVCPSCDNELKYSEEEEEDSGGRSAKKVRTKKDREEHHFWAVKACGHVYCKSCYDNRKKHSKGKDSAAAKTGFQFQPSETARSVKIYCAVDDCESEVSPNNAWVGIFM